MIQQVQETIVSTREPQVSREDVSEDSNSNKNKYKNKKIQVIGRQVLHIDIQTGILLHNHFFVDSSKMACILQVFIYIFK